MARILNDQLEKFRLNFSCCANRDVTPFTDLVKSTFTPNQIAIITELQKKKREREREVKFI